VRCASSFCRPSSWWPALLLALFFATWCLPGLSAQSQSSSPQLTPLQQSLILDSLKQLLTVKELSALLGSDLQTWPQQIANLQATSARLLDENKSISDKSKSDLAVSEAARQQTQSAYESLQAAQTKESATFSDYVKASESAQQLLNQQLAQERAHRVLTDYTTWAAVGAAAGAIGGAAAGKDAVSAAAGAGIGAGAAFVIKLGGDLFHKF